MTSLGAACLLPRRIKGRNPPPISCLLPPLPADVRFADDVVAFAGHKYYPSMGAMLDDHAGKWPCLPEKVKAARGVGVAAGDGPTRPLAARQKAAVRRSRKRPAECTVQQYVESALLLGRTRKFDVRTWLVMTTLSPPPPPLPLSPPPERERP